jgi:pimeloyl-ACP methyl ester carboxylesterase
MRVSQRISANRQRRWRIWLIVAIIAVLAANTIWVDSRTRPASPRDGGKIIDTGVGPVNVKVEGLDVAHVKVVGHSMGGEVTVALAESNPERIDCMILIDSLPAADTTFTIMTKIYLMSVVGEMLSHFKSYEAIRRGLAQGFAPNFLISERFVTDLRQLTYRAFRAAHDESIAYRTARPPYRRLEAIKPSPRLLVIFGSLDVIVPPEHTKLFERVPGAKSCND